MNSFNETFPGWITNDGKYFKIHTPGYTQTQAENTATTIRSNMEKLQGIKEVIVKIIPVAQGYYKVVNNSTYRVV